MGSYAAGNSPAGALAQAGQQGLMDIANRNSKNKTLNNQVWGSLADSYKTMSDTSAAILYNDAFMASLTKQQLGLEEAKGTNAIKLAGVEGSIRERQTRVEGEEGRAGTRVVGDEERKTVATRGEQDRLGFVTQGEQSRLGMQTQGDENRKSFTHQTNENERGMQMMGDRADRVGRRWFG